MLVCREHKTVIDNHSRSNAWIRAQNHNTFFGEPDNDIGPSNGIPDIDVDLRWSRKDVPGDVINMPTHDQHSEYMEEDMDTSEENEDFDDVDWDWMQEILGSHETVRKKKGSTDRKRQRLTDVIEEQDLLESHNPEAGVCIQVDSTNNVVQPVEEQLQLNSTPLKGYLYLCIIVDSSTKKRQRGQTKMLAVHGRHDRKLIVLNKAGQPVGPSNDVVIELSNFIDTLARNATLSFIALTQCPNFQEKYDIPEIGNRWTLKTIQEAWRRRKFDLKTHHFDAYANDQIRKKSLMMFQHLNLRNFLNIGTQKNFRGVTKTTLKGKVGNFEASSNATNDLVKKMEDRMLRMEEKIKEQKEQFDQQKTTIR
ncbi:hypothetical protein H5410_022293 [Solanum commersonii]|uniref:Uncharacterized protein n=1 Tax=Solanum commersonii TaxID=4109 RepID=A0A9J5ZHM0_SOLCO|nr:hypothetical protein H5410_022293 [Solanum commersonii]